jgi:4-hydroxybenzoate polyprenyltransferase
MRSVGREDVKRIASLVLVAVIATFSLPLVASALGGAVDGTPSGRTHIRGFQVEARPVANRRPLTQREGSLSTASLLVAALTLLGLLVLAAPTRPAGLLGLLPVQRGPPSSR